jgi:hypothetical protein
MLMGLRALLVVVSLDVSALARRSQRRVYL